VFEFSNLPDPVIRYGIGLWRRRWLIMGVTWLVALFGWFAIWLLPDAYESRAQVFVQTESILDPIMTGVTARPNYERRVDVMRLQLLTRPNIEQVIYRAGLDSELKATGERARQAEMESLVEWVTSKIAIDSPQEMYFVITFQHGDPEISRNVVDALVNLLIEQDLGAGLAESEEARRQLDRQIEEYGDRLTAKEQEVAAFRREHLDELGVIDGNARRRDQIDLDLSRVADELSQARQQVSTLQTLLASTARTSSGDDLDKLLVELAALRSQYNESHPDIVMLKARIDELSAEAGNRLPTNPEYTRVRNDLSAARDRVAGLQERQNDLRAEEEALSFTLGQAPAVQAELRRIERDYEQTRKNYEELLERLDRLTMTENLGAGRQGVNYRVYERPSVAFKPVDRKRLFLIIGALIVALGAGAAVAALFTFLEKTFTQTNELQKAFNLPVLGALSEAPSEALVAKHREDRMRLASAFGALCLLGFVYSYFAVFKLPDFDKDGAQTAKRAAQTVLETGPALRDVR
jgi:polysaccharide chain length determinant protein (PEP-CTERM system associated)